MANTYGDLKARVAAELLRSDQAANIINAITRAIEFYAPRRFWFNEGKLTANTTPGVDLVTYPTGLRVDDAVFITVGGTGYPMTRRTYAEIEELSEVSPANTGQPTDYCTINGQLRLYLKPNLAYVVTAVGVFDQPALAVDADFNAWTGAAQDLISARARMTISRDILRDPELAQSAAQAEQEALRRLLAETTRRTSTGRLQASD